MQSLRLRKIPRYPRSLYRSFPISARLLRTSTGSQSHSTDSYVKDVDETPPHDPKIHRVDATSEAAQHPYEPQRSQAGDRTSEYEHVNKNELCDTPKGQVNGKKLRYGGTKRFLLYKGI
ncbi:hypothetical protein DFH29DRAFT_590488 [Suillus ampliporus]|nr:hypothetical protein DFH29DRAFT_590488 [Suillus ampliporus]